MENMTLIQGDCLLEMPKLKERSIDFIFIDLPYGTTQNKWDEVIPFEPMWENLLRLIKPNGAMVFTATQPFSSKLVLSQLKLFKYEMIWEKTICSGQLNVKRQPLRAHESILVFYEQQPVYNEQKTTGEPYKIQRKINFKEQSYGAQKDSSKVNDGFRHAKSIIKISNPRIKGGHPTQKPIELMEHIIKMFTNEGDTVLDCCMGSGTTGVACLNLKRKFVGIELDEVWYNRARERITVF
jgi:site-specific DNA-methyltransferase (adenine-specific)